MIKLHDGGAYLVNGTEIIPDKCRGTGGGNSQNRKNSHKAGSCTADDRIWYFEGS